MDAAERDRTQRLVARFVRAGATARATLTGGVLVSHEGRSFHFCAADLYRDKFPTWARELLKRPCKRESST